MKMTLSAVSISPITMGGIWLANHRGECTIVSSFLGLLPCLSFQTRSHICIRLILGRFCEVVSALCAIIAKPFCEDGRVLLVLSISTDEKSWQHGAEQISNLVGTEALSNRMCDCFVDQGTRGKSGRTSARLKDTTEHS